MSVYVNVEDGLTNGATGVVKFVEHKIEGSDRPSIIWMIPVFEVERTYVYRFKMYQRIQFPLRTAAANTVHKAEDEIVVDLTQYNRIRKEPHIHYVAFSSKKIGKSIHSKSKGSCHSFSRTCDCRNAEVENTSGSSA